LGINLANFKKYYFVFIGKTPGVYENFDDCMIQVLGFPGSAFCKFSARSAASAFAEYEKRKSLMLLGISNKETLCVDGAYNGTECEYQAVWHPSKKQAFKSKVFVGGTNNIAEFLGLVEAIKFLHKNNLEPSVYTDSITALTWVRNKKANTSEIEKKISKF